MSLVALMWIFFTQMFFFWLRYHIFSEVFMSHEHKQSRTLLIFHCVNNNISILRLNTDDPTPEE